jgi:hypothetical protein
MGNHWHVLVRPEALGNAFNTHRKPQVETLDKSFEKPLRQHIAEYRTEVSVWLLFVIH